MEKVITMAQVIVPIFVAVFLGLLSKKKQLISREGVQGFQSFVMRFGLPCVVFNSCLNANLGASIMSIVLVMPTMLLVTFWAFRARKKQFPYYNFPQMFAGKELGMLGIPLFIILFGEEQAYHIGVMVLAQSVTAFPTIAILSADAGDDPSAAQIVKKVLTSPLVVMSSLGLILNVTGIGAWLDQVGVGGILRETTGFLSQPVGALMIFSIGYNFSMEKECRSKIFQISAVHFSIFAVFCLLVQAVLCLIPDVHPLTRWAILMHYTLPASYLAPGLGRSDEDYKVASGVCSVLTVVCLIVFCIIAAAVA